MAAGGSLLSELTLAVRRSTFLSLLLAIGALAAALPTLLGEPKGEHPALRGLAALVIAFLVATFLVAKWGSRGPLAPRLQGRALAKVAASVTALLLPALFAGMTTSEAESLVRLAQAAIGWTRPIAALPLALGLLGAAYVVARLRSSVKDKSLAGRGLVWATAVALLAAIAVSAWRLLQIPAPAGIEMLSKAVLLLVLVSWWPSGAPALSTARGGRSRDRASELHFSRGTMP